MNLNSSPCCQQYYLSPTLPSMNDSTPHSSMLDNIHNLSIYIPTIFSYPASDSEDDTMGSPTPDSRRCNGMSRRDSIRSNSSSRRPRLLRSSATAPSITASTASRNALATPQTSRRATDLLNQVAFSTSPPNSASPLSQSPSSLYEEASLPREVVDLEAFRPHLGMFIRIFLYFLLSLRDNMFRVHLADSISFHRRFKPLL